MRRRSSSQKLRKIAFERDSGICANCAADCEKVKRVFWAILDYDAQCWYGEIIASDGRIFWEVDHILEVADNGSDSHRNLQTLCTVCHRAKSAAFASRPCKQGRITPIHTCLGGCDGAKLWEHANDILYELEERYDALFYIGDNRRLTVNVGPGMKPDYMRNAHPVVTAHRAAMHEVIADCYAVVPVEMFVM